MEREAALAQRVLGLSEAQQHNSIIERNEAESQELLRAHSIFASLADKFDSGSPAAITLSGKSFPTFTDLASIAKTLDCVCSRFQERCIGADEDLSQLRQQFDKVETGLAREIGRNEDISEQYKNCEIQLNEFMSRQERPTSGMQQLASELTETKSRHKLQLESVNLRLQAKTSVSNAYQSLHNRDVETLDSIKEVNKSLNAQILSTSEKGKALADSMDTSRRKDLELRQKLRIIAGSLGVSQNEGLDLRKELVETERSLGFSRTESDKLRASLKQHETAHQQATQAADAERREATGLRLQLDDYETQLNQARNEIHRFQEQLQSKGLELQEMNRRADAREQSLQEKLEADRRELQEQQTSTLFLRGEVREQRQRSTALEDTLRRKDSQIADLQKQLDQYRSGPTLESRTSTGSQSQGLRNYGASAEKRTFAHAFPSDVE